MKRLDGTDLATLELGGAIYDKTNPTLKPDFDRMWKRVTAFAKSLYGIIVTMNRPTLYEVGKSRNYLQQAGRGKFYYPRFVWVRYIAQGEKRNTPAVSLVLKPDSLSFSIDFMEKYEGGGNVDRDAFEAVLAEHGANLERAGYAKTVANELTRFSFTYPAKAIDDLSDEEFDEEARHHFSLLLPLYENMVSPQASAFAEPQDFGLPDNAALSPHSFTSGHESSYLGTGVAAAALASVRGTSHSAENTSLDHAAMPGAGGPRTVVRRRRTPTTNASAPNPEPSPSAPGARPRPPAMEQGSALPPTAFEEGVHEHDRRLKPLPPVAQPVSLVPPPIAADAPGVDLLRKGAPLILSGPADVNLYGVVFAMVGALVREQLCKPKKRHEIILDALENPSPEDVLALALYSAPRGLSLVALQTHDLVLHYYRRAGTWTQSLRNVIRQCLLEHPDDEGARPLFARLPNDSWALTQEGQRFVETNFRYALQEAGKRKPRRYSISDFAVIFSRESEGFPPLYEAIGEREGPEGSVQKLVICGDLLRLIRRAAKDLSNPYAVALIHAEPEDITEAFGALSPLMDPANRGSGPYAPSILIPNVGQVSIPPNLHVIISLRPGVSLGHEEKLRIQGGFRLVDWLEIVAPAQSDNPGSTAAVDEASEPSGNLQHMPGH